MNTAHTGQTINNAQHHAILDTGCTAHTLRADAPVLHSNPSAPKQVVGTPTGDTMISTASALIQNSNFPIEARQAHIYPKLAYKSLLSVGQLCDSGYAAVFKKNNVSIIKEDDVTITGPTQMSGYRDHNNNQLWVTDINENGTSTKNATSQNKQVNSVFKMRTLRDLVTYHHQSVWNPVVKTWTRAIDRGHFATFPGLSSKVVRKHLQPSIATAKGHMTKERQNIRSTKDPNNKPTVTIKKNLESKEFTNTATFKTVDFKDATGKISTDLTGRFPVRASTGAQYLMVVHVRDPNVILAFPLKNRSQTCLMEAYNVLYDKIIQKGFTPVLHICDNECPNTFKKFLSLRHVNLQRVPPYDHRTNPAEGAINVFKSHFIAGLANLPPSFPLHLWDRLVPHAELTLNLLRDSNTHPQLSAHAHWEGVYDYNAHPLAPPGCKVVVHETLDQRGTWDEKGKDGWYLGPSMEHYRCHRVYIPTTRAERIGKSVRFFPHNCVAPEVDPRDEATRAAQLLTAAIEKAQKGGPYSPPTPKQLTALQQLSDIFYSLTHENEKPPSGTLRNNKTEQSDALQKAQQPRVPELLNTNYVTQPRVVEAETVSREQPKTTTPTLLPPKPTIVPYEPHEVSEVRHNYNLRSSRKYACAVTNEKTGKLEEYGALVKGPNKHTWTKAYANDLGRLAQGVGSRIKGTNTIFFIPRRDVPPGRKVTYGKKEVSIRPNKEEMHRVRLTVGGDKLVFDGDTATQCASLITTKIHINSVISTKGARYACIDIKNMYYGTPMDEYEYMRIRYAEVPPEIVQQYELDKIQHEGWVYIEIRKGMPGLKQAGKIANIRLTNHLERYGYKPCPFTPSLWKHKERPISFTLVVDDFGVKYVGKEHFQHLTNALSGLYEITVDETGSKYLGMTLEWDYENRFVDISMPGYVKKALHRFQHAPTKVRNSPYPAPIPQYGKKQQFTVEDDSSPVSTVVQKKIQQIVGTFLYYALTIDLTMLVALGSIASQQNAPTEKTEEKVNWFLDYCASNPEAKIRYHASDMVLWAMSDASYLSEPNAKSRAGGLFFLSNNIENPGTPPKTPPKLNGIVGCLAKIIRQIMSSAMEAEVCAAYENAREACPMRETLRELGHKQPPTPIQVDNSTAVGFANKTIKHKRSKAIDMRLHWLADRVKQRQFTVFWAPGEKNYADYVTKHHPAPHHQTMRPKFFQS